MQRILVIFLSAVAICAPVMGQSKKPKNVIFILADDLGYGELGCYGQKKIRTPHIDQLAAEGTRFTHHYSGAPVCAPARCVLMTGKHLGHAEIRGNRQASVSMPQFKEGQYPISADVRTLAMAYREAGYATGAMGKWGLGPVGTSGEPAKKGFDLFYGYNCQAVAHSFYPRFLWRNDKQIEINPKPIPGHKKLKPDSEVRMEDFISKTYSSKPILAEALDFIRSNKDKKFFLYLPFIEPHMAMHPPIDLVNEYPREWDTRPHRGESGYLPHPRPRAGYAAMVTDLDRHVGAVVSELKKAGILDDTLIIFTSDNGATHAANDPQFNIGGLDAAFFNSSGGLKGFKGSVYEGGIRVPMIARLPGSIPAGKTNAAPSYFADWFPTLAAASDIKGPEEADGENLWPILCGGDIPAKRKPMVWVYPEYSGQVNVRSGNIKVMRRGLKTKKPLPWEVYDVEKDPSESNNLAETMPDAISNAIAILREQISPNEIFPFTIEEITR